MKNLKHNNKTALVTGAASGLGFQFSLSLAKDSYNLILIDIDAKTLNTHKSVFKKTII